MVFYVWRHFDLLTAKDRANPLSSPGSLRQVIYRGERLKLHELRRFAREHPANVMPIATHGDGGSAYRATKIECEYLRSRIAPELKRDQRQQYGFAGARRSNHQSMSDVSNVKGEAKWSRSFRLGQEERRRLEMVVPHLPGPYS